MHEAQEEKKQSLQLLTLFGFFALSLLLAYIMVISKTAVKLSSPIKLGHSGLAVSLPKGKGWDTQQNWQPLTNEYSISSKFPKEGQFHMLIDCRVVLGKTETSAEDIFQERASQLQGDIIEIYQVDNDTLLFDMASMTKPKTSTSFFIAVARLPFNRSLYIELLQRTGDIDHAREVFHAIAEKTEFHDQGLTQAGADIIQQIKNKGVTNFLQSQQQNYYIHKDNQDNSLGFDIDITSLPDPDQDLSIEVSTLSFFRRTRFFEQQMSYFQCDEAIDQFKWRSSISTQRSSVTFRIEAEYQKMVVERLSRFPEEKSYSLSDAAIPDILTDLVFEQMLLSGRQQISIDIIDSKGDITPTLISKTMPQDAAGHQFIIQFLGSDKTGKIFFDDEMKITKLVWPDKTIFRTTAEKIAEQFPRQAELLLQSTILKEMEKQF
jgi:hypothetical protein